jgi:hypothetical protein
VSPLSGKLDLLLAISPVYNYALLKVPLADMSDPATVLGKGGK